MWYTPILQRARSVGRSTSHDLSCARTLTTTLWPEERAQVPAAVALPGQLSRVLGCHPDTDLAAEIRRLGNGIRVHGAAVAHELRDATLSGGTLYAKGVRKPLTPHPSKLGGSAPMRHFERAVLTSTHYGTRYFGHFLTDDCTSALTAEQLGLPAVRIENPHAQARGYELAFELAVNVLEEAHFDQLDRDHGRRTDVGQAQALRDASVSA